MRRNRAAFSLIELVVALGIMGILMAILLPAVQQARATSRRIDCSNRLKEIGVALHTFESGHGYYPVHGHGGGLSALADIHLAMGLPVLGKYPPYYPPHGTPVFRCPADSPPPIAIAPPVDGIPSHSYLFNAGTHFRRGDRYRNGFAPLFEHRYARDITDGASQTVAMSERLLITNTPPFREVVEAYPRRYLWWTSRAIPRDPGNEPLVIESCKNDRTSLVPGTVYFGNVADEGYDHRLPPNRYGCWNGPPGQASMYDPTVPATSMHDGGVNVLFVDGHVQFVPDHIDEAVWQALGTINGEETIANSAF